MCWTTRVVFADASLLVVEEGVSGRTKQKRSGFTTTPPQGGDRGDAILKMNVDERAHRIRAREKGYMGKCCASVTYHGLVAQ